MFGFQTHRGSAVSVLFLFCVFFYSCSTTQTVQQPADTSSGSDETPDRTYIQPIDPPFTFDRAVQQGTRTRSGEPGPAYWQQWTHYDLDARLYPQKRRLEGTGTITYYNHSPDTLQRLLMELVQNHHAPGNVRNEEAEITGGITIDSLTVDGVTLEADTQNVPNYSVNATRLILDPASPLPPDDSTTIQVSWSFEIPSKGIGGRMGYDKDNLYYIGYWYPVMSVYDDVSGWFTDPFRGRAEFYFGFGDYELDLTAPRRWVLMSTGQLLNAEEVFADDVLQRYRKAQNSDEVVHIISKQDFGEATTTGTDSLLTWSFRADSVRDVAFSATTESLWDAARASVGDRDGDGSTDYTLVNAFYRSDAKLWEEAVSHLQHSVRFLSDYTGMAYPWPHMTAVEGDGIIGGGMEYPMMTVIGAYHGQESSDLYNVINHELGHMWMPMITGTNERRYSWMDEGTTTFNENVSRSDRYPMQNHWSENRRAYLNLAGSGYEGEVMRWSDFHYDGYLFTIASYYKPALLLYSLREVLGKSTFEEAFQTVFDRWAYKHPQPWDLFNTFEDVSGRDLDWFWRSWYYETWVMDQAVKSVNSDSGLSTIVIENVGRVPMPVELEINLSNGETIERTIPVDAWLDGSTETSVTVAQPSTVERVQIDPDRDNPDVNRRNNTWTR